MKKRSTSRGYSILAALVFVAVLSGITVAVNFIGSSGNPIAMSAALGVPTAPGAGVPANQLPPSVLGTGQEAGRKNQCQPGFDYKIRRGLQQDLPQIEAVQVCPPPGQSQTKPEDIKPKGPSTPGVLLTGAAIFALETGAGGTFGQRNDPARCEKVPNANPEQWKPKSTYKCKVRYCTPLSASGERCIEVSNLFNPNATFDLKNMENQLRAPLIADVMKYTPPSAQAQILRDMGVSPSEQAGLNSVFTEQHQQLGTQVGQNQTRISEIDKILADCADCFASERVKLQEEKAKLEEANKQLTTQMSNLAAAQRVNLTPPNTPPIQNPPLPQPRPEQPSTFPGGNPSSPGGFPGGSNPMGALGSLLQGLMKGLGGAQQGPPCASDPNAYQQQQQQYQMQMQQYNYQLQQYNYDVQRAEMYGLSRPIQPEPPAQCTPNPNANTCPTPPPQPTSGCSNGTWRAVTTQMSNGRQCTSSWQCTPTNATPPTAELSCQPKVVDVGMSVAITFSCGNATGSTGSAFSTENQVSGATTTIVANPPSNATGITYGLTCRNQNLTARAECKVQIARPAIVLTANPKNVVSGESSTVGWITSGMESCVISSPQMPGFTMQHAANKRVNGVATTSPLTRDTTVVLTCETIGGNTKAASTTITVGNSTSTAALEVTSTIDGRTDVRHGATTTISWNAPSPPADSAIVLWLVDILSGQATSIIQRSLATSGTYLWTLPATSTPCPADSPSVCGADLIVGRSYAIQASLYSPPNAHLGGYPPADPITPTYYDQDVTASFKMSN